MRALVVVVPILGILTIAYRYYSAFIAAKVMALDDARVTPAHQKFDGSNYFPTSRWVLFGITSLRSPAPARWSARCWRPNSAMRPGSSG
jgi:carbon starvation protein CstA